MAVYKNYSTFKVYSYFNSTFLIIFKKTTIQRKYSMKINVFRINFTNSVKRKQCLVNKDTVMLLFKHYQTFRGK